MIERLIYTMAKNKRPLDNERREIKSIEIVYPVIHCDICASESIPRRTMQNQGTLSLLKENSLVGR